MRCHSLCTRVLNFNVNYTSFFKFFIKITKKLAISSGYTFYHEILVGSIDIIPPTILSSKSYNFNLFISKRLDIADKVSLL